MLAPEAEFDAKSRINLCRFVRLMRKLLGVLALSYQLCCLAQSDSMNSRLLFITFKFLFGFYLSS